RFRPGRLCWPGGASKGTPPQELPLTATGAEHIPLAGVPPAARTDSAGRGVCRGERLRPGSPRRRATSDAPCRPLRRPRPPPPLPALRPLRPPGPPRLPPTLQLLLLPVPHLLRVGRLLLLHVSHAAPQQVINDPRQLVGRGRDGLRCPQPGPLPPQVGSQVTVAAHQAPRRQP